MSIQVGIRVGELTLEKVLYYYNNANIGILVFASSQNEKK